jgi:hypothetical protein
MRSAPAFQLCPQRSVGWLVFVVAIFLLLWGVLAAWWVSSFQSANGPSLVPVLSISLSLGCGYGLYRASVRRPGSLRWDGQCWHWGPMGSAGHEPVSGQARVSLDLGVFLLIYLRPDSSLRSPGVWLPLERRRHLADWHLLRCALQISSNLLSAGR